MVEDSNSREKLREQAALIEGTDESREQLQELAEYRMPFGKYKGCRLVDLPEPYVVWFAQNGFPRGKLGELMKIIYEIKANGLEYLFKPLHHPEKG